MPSTSSVSAKSIKTFWIFSFCAGGGATCGAVAASSSQQHQPKFLPDDCFPIPILFGILHSECGRQTDYVSYSFFIDCIFITRAGQLKVSRAVHAT